MRVNFKHISPEKFKPILHGRLPVTETTYSIGQMCAEFGVTARTLRFYENDKGLLNPIREGQKRLFTNRCRARLKLILRGARFGFSLNEIKDLLELYEIGDGQVTQLSATLDAAERHHAELIAQRDELNDAISDMEEQMAQVRDMLQSKGTAQAAE